MRGRKKGRALLFTVAVLVVCITERAAAGSDGDEEEHFLGAAGPQRRPGHSVCAMKADEGPCKAVHMRYYFNMQSSSCEVFEYGGCHGNENNFLTLEECRKKCVAAELPRKRTFAEVRRERPDICFHEKDPGICRGYFSRYFYNKETGLCELFKYGGCLGNQNNFRSMEECQATCEGSGNVSVPPTAPSEEVSIAGSSSSPKEGHSRFPIFFERPPIPSLCLSPVDRGLCRAKELRFFYNYAARRCQPFSYSGCGGNENNFTSRKSCLRICKKGLNQKNGGMVVKIKKKRKKQPVKVLGEESVPESPRL